MRKVKIASKRRTVSGCPTIFKGTVVVDGRVQDFEAHYRGWGLTLTVSGEDISVDARGQSDGVCSWDEIKDPLLAALKEHFNSAAYDRLENERYAD